MKQLVSKGIILARTDFGEADRIITLLTPDHGKLRLMARGVRKVKSKLAGGIELFSVSNITFIQGKGEIGTLISTRLIKYYGQILADIDRVQLGYDLIKMLNRATEDQTGPEYFELLEQTFAALDDSAVGLELIRVWFAMQLLRLGGHAPNLATTFQGSALKEEERYNFDLEHMAFTPDQSGRFTANHIKLLRLGFSHHTPKVLQQVTGLEKLLPDVEFLIQTMLSNYIRI